ncbi:MAG: hypothetical protein WKG07_09605 [Hymenobacter sp.]
MVAFFLPWLLGPMQVAAGRCWWLLMLLDAAAALRARQGQPGARLRAAGAGRQARQRRRQRRAALPGKPLPLRHPDRERLMRFRTSFSGATCCLRPAIEPGQTQVITYQLRPTKRGEYEFGALNVYAASPLRLVRRRFRYDAEAQGGAGVPVVFADAAVRAAGHPQPPDGGGREAHPAGGAQHGV